MGTRAGRSLASLGLRCLRRQLHSDHGRQLPLACSENLAVLSSATSSPSSSCSSVEGRIDEGQQEMRYFSRKLLDLAASSVESAEKLSMKDSFGIGSWHLQNSQDRSTDDWSIGVLNNGCRFSQGIQCLNSETIAARYGDKASIFRDQDFVSRYLQWRSYNRSVTLVESQSNPDGAAMSAVDMGGLLSVTRQNCTPGLLLSSSMDFLEETSEITPLEASSVKRKRKKKMNKHKQRKLRRRDRHRN